MKVLMCADTLTTFAVSKGVQTDTEVFFSSTPTLPEELTFGEYGDIVKTTTRLYGLLRKYQWNIVSSLYLPTARKLDDVEEAPQMPPDKSTTGVKSAKAAQAALKVRTMHSIREKVELAHQKASISQLEEELLRLQACAKDGFDIWIHKTVAELAPDKAPLPPALDPEELWNVCLELVSAEGMRRRVRQLEDSLQSLMPLVEMVRGGDPSSGDPGSAVSSFWRRVMKEVRQDGIDLTVGKSLVSKSKKSSAESSSPQLQVPSMDKVTLLGELASIWASLSRWDGSQESLQKKPTQQVMQNFIKAFYLRKSGRSKHVEASIVRLCRSVLDQVASSPKVALFAVVCDIQPATALGAGLPRARREGVKDPSFVLDPQRLGSLPLDAAHVVAQFMQELKKRGSRRTLVSSMPSKDSGESAGLAGSDQQEVKPLRIGAVNKARGGKALLSDFEEEDESLGETPLPLDIVLSAARDVVSSRSRATARYFEMALFSFADISAEAPWWAQSTPASPVSPKSSAPTFGLEAGEGIGDADPAGGEAAAPAGVGVGAGPTVGELRQQHQEVLFVSHLLRAYLTETIAHPDIMPSWVRPSSLEGVSQEEKMEGILSDMWEELLDRSSVVNCLRKTLGLGGLAGASLCTAAKLAEVMEKLGITHLHPTLLARALVSCAGAGRQPAGEVEIRHEHFVRLTSSWRDSGGDQSAGCSESMALWATLWALAMERAYEMDLMGNVFTLFDDSGDGWLQYAEFDELFETLFPAVTKAETEDLFLFAAESSSGDMTREIFVGLILRLGITMDLDELEDLVNSKRAFMFGERPVDASR